MTVKGLRGICEAYKLNPSHMSKVGRGIYNQHRRWTSGNIPKLLNHGPLTLFGLEVQVSDFRVAIAQSALSVPSNGFFRPTALLF
jgi:hypothetical protein